MYIRTCLTLTLVGLLTSIIIVSGAGSVATSDLANRVETVEHASSLSRHLGEIERSRQRYQWTGTIEDLDSTLGLIETAWDMIATIGRQIESDDLGHQTASVVRLEASFGRYRRLLKAYAESRDRQTSAGKEMLSQLEGLRTMATKLKQSKESDFNRTFATMASVQEAESRLKTTLRLSALANEIIVVQMSIARSVALFKGGDKLAAADIPLKVGRFAEIADRIRHIEQVETIDQLDVETSQLPNLIAKHSNKFQILFDEFRLAAREQQSRTADMAAVAVEVTDLIQTINANQTRAAISSSDLNLALSGLGLFVALGLGAISLVIVRRRIITPLTAITNAMERMSGGELSVAAPGYERADELGAMANALEILRQNSLEARRLAAENVIVAQELAKEQAEANFLEQSLKKEKELSKQQRSFVSLVSHEFRTPLAVIDGQAQRLLRKGGDMAEDRRHDSLKKIRTAVTRLTGLMESVLSSASLDAGAITFNPEPMNLKMLIEDVCQSQQELCTKHKINVDICALPDKYLGDPKLITQVITNLLSNAIKYSPDADLVEVNGYGSSDEVVISVRDYGLGIPEDDIPKMFQRFFRAKTSFGIQGTGIGLNLVKTFVEMHDGTLELTSTEGEGSTFIVKLPKACSGQASIPAVA